MRKLRSRAFKLLRKIRRLFIAPPVQVAVCCATGVGIPLLIYGYRRSQELAVRELDVALPDLPPAFDGYRVIHVSDIHATRVKARERRLFELVGGLEADLLALTGDYQYCDATRPEGVLEMLERLAAAHRCPDGVVAIRGNHDRKKLHHALEHQPFMHYLRDTAHVVERDGAALAFGGLSYPHRRPRRFEKSLCKIERHLPPGAFRILLSHPPDILPLAAEHGYRLVLAGDTHGGQIRLPGIGAPYRKTRLPRRFAYGLNSLDGAQCYTTSGVGVTGLPVRLNCSAEIAVLTLRREAAAPSAS